jgi:hypothetical protein
LASFYHTSAPSTNRELTRLLYNLRDLLSIQKAELAITHKSFGGYKELKHV